MSYHGHGLGQTESVTTLAARSAQLRALQTALMQSGALHIGTADGVISSASSPTLAAVQSWASSHGLPTTGIARTSSGGLALPASVLASITSGASATPSGTTPSDGGGKGGPSTPSAVLPSPDMTIDTPSGGLPRWVPWAGGAVALVVIAAAVIGRR